jgi:hypothetical protein
MEKASSCRFSRRLSTVRSRIGAKRALDFNVSWYISFRRAQILERDPFARFPLGILRPFDLRSLFSVRLDHGEPAEQRPDEGARYGRDLLYASGGSDAAR